MMCLWCAYGVLGVCLWCRLCLSLSVCGVVWCGCCRRSRVTCLLLSGDCRRCVACCTLTFRADVEISFATLMRFMVTPVVCPRLFEFHTTLTYGAQRRNHVVTTPLETIAKKTNTETRKARCPRAISNLSRSVKNTTEVGREVRQCWGRCAGCCVVKLNDISRLWRFRKNHICDRT